MRINTNIAAIIANKNLTAAQEKASKSLERLSSGYKINHASDDAAGMAIAAKLRTQIRGLEQSSKNAADGISVVQTAEGALNEIEAMLQRVRELAVQGANGSMVDEDRESIQSEMKQLLSEVDRIANDTEFNKKTLLNGTLDRKSFTNQTGVSISYASSEVPAGDYVINIVTSGKQAEYKGAAGIAFSGNNGCVSKEEAGTIQINGYRIEIKEGETREAVCSKLIDAADRLNVTVEGCNGNATDELTFRTYEYGSEERLQIKCDNSLLATALGIGTDISVTGSDMEATIQTGTAGKGFAGTASIYCYGNTATVTDLKGFKLTYELDESYPGGAKQVTAQVTDMGTMTVHIGANEGQVLDIRLEEVSCKKLGLEYMNLLTEAGSSKAISMADEAIAKISSIRSEIGACQNRLDAAASSLDVTGENMNSAISRIEDVNMAEEMASYTQLNVLSQAGVSMVAQANELPQMVLQLLQ